MDNISFKITPLIDDYVENEEDFKLEKVRYKSSIDVNNRVNTKR